MTWRDRTIIVIDTETTGVETCVDRIVEVGAVAMRHGEIAGRTSWLVNPGMPIPAAATEAHGITDAMVADAPRFADVAIEIAALVESVDGAVVAAYNGRFDRAQMIAEYLRLGAVPPFLHAANAWIDPLVWARAAHPYAKGAGRFKLGAVADRLGVEKGTAHRATGDCETTARVLWALQAWELHPESGLARMPDDFDDLVLHQRRLAAFFEWDRLVWQANRRAEEARAEGEAAE